MVNINDYADKHVNVINVRQNHKNMDVLHLILQITQTEEKI